MENLVSYRLSITFVAKIQFLTNSFAKTDPFLRKLCQRLFSSYFNLFVAYAIR